MYGDYRNRPRTSVGQDPVSQWAIDWDNGSNPETFVGNVTTATHTLQGTRTYAVYAVAVDDGSYRTNTLSVASAGGTATPTQPDPQQPQARVLLCDPDGTLDGWSVVQRGGSTAGKGTVTIAAGTQRCVWFTPNSCANRPPIPGSATRSNFRSWTATNVRSCRRR